MAYFPFFMELEEKRCVVAGGGNVAARKVRTLLEFGAEILVISPECSEEMDRLLKSPKIHWEKKPVSLEELEGADFVVAATDDPVVNERIVITCKEKNILVDSAKSETKGNVVFPSVIKRDDVVVGITSGGKNPAISKALRKRIEHQIPENIGTINEQLNHLREQIKKTEPDIKKRKQLMEQLLEELLERE